MIYPFSPKSRAFLARDIYSEPTMNFLIGAVRSGKTMTTIVKLLLLCKYEVDSPHERFIVGHSKEAVMRNVLKPLFAIVGRKNYSYRATDGLLTLFGIEWKVVAAHDAGSFQAIQGSTVLVALIDEVVNVHKTFFDMLYSRLSLPESRLYATGNPGPPNHYLKTDYLDKPELQQDIWYETFNLDDNLSLDPAVKDRLRRSFTGVFYKRNILALWVAGEGAIFVDAFSEERNTYDDATAPKGLYNSRHPQFIACDVGTVNQHVYLKIVQTEKICYVDDEWIWDSKVQNKQMTNGQYADELKKWMPAGAQVIVDPSAAAFRAELTTKGIWHIEAQNDVLPGIQHLCSMFALGLLKIHKRCKTTLKQVEAYCWDEKAIARTGKEGPVKAFDHTCDALRYYAYTKVPTWKLKAA